jgi:Protein kinase domain
MNSIPPPKPLGPRMQRSHSGVPLGHPSLGGEDSDYPMTDDLSLPAPAPRLTRAASAATPRPSLTLSLDPKSTPYHSNESRFPEGRTAWIPADSTATVVAGARNGFSSPVEAQTAQSPPNHGPDEHRTALPITPRSMSKIVSLSDLRQLVHRMEAPPPPSPASLSLRTNENVPGNGGDVAAGPGTRGVWSDDVLDVVALLGEGASGAVEGVQDKRTGRRFARKTIITHEGPLKQLVRELAFLSGLRCTNIVRFYGAYMSPSNSEVKLVMELCEGKSLAAIGEQIKRRKGRVGEKVARIMAEEVSCVCLVPSFFFPSLPLHFPCHLTSVCLTPLSLVFIGELHLTGPGRPCVPAFQESHPQGYQALQHPPLAPGRSQTL